jgi:uncharacterized protein
MKTHIFTMLQPIHYIKLSLLTVLLIITTNCTGESQDNRSIVADDEIEESAFNKELAEELGADNYGMKRYVMAFLKAGSNRDQDPDAAAEIQRGHMDYINRLAEDGKLVLAGPFLGGGEMRGIFLFDVETIDEARELTATDPAVQSGRLEMELHPWYGSAALLKVNEIHSTIASENP